MKFSWYILKMRYDKFVYKLKETFLYKPHRAVHGWAPNDTWNLDGYMSKVLVESLTHLRDNSSGYPSHYASHEAWKEELNGLIKAFDDYNNFEEESSKRYEMIHKKHGVPMIHEAMKDKISSSISEEFTSVFNDPKYKLPSDAYTEFFENEDLIMVDIKKRMHKIIDLWGNLWD